MTCHVCGGTLEKVQTNLPFKVSDTTIVILKDLPVLQCANCSEYVLEDVVMQKVDEILAKASHDAELEVIRYAA
ncbi:MAG: YgiT-type zinc finger protein [Ignavibacteriae bacterium]|nr:YgiT-type zinc finger protein [Ignavibacteriota bacterium]